MTCQSHGMIATYASPAPRHAFRSLPDRRTPHPTPPTSARGPPPSAAAPGRSPGQVWWRTPGHPGSRPPGGAAGHPPTAAACHVELRPGLPVCRDAAENTVVTQFSTFPVHPGVLRHHARARVPVLDIGVSSIAIPGPIRSRSRSGSQAAASPGSSARRSFQSHTYSRAGLHPVLPLISSRLGQVPAVRPRPARQRGHVAEGRPDTAALRHHPAQNHPDLRVHTRGGRPDILYAGPRGRVVVVVCHKAANVSRPPQVTRL